MITTKIENRFDNRRRPNKYQHHRNQHKAQVIFEFLDQNMMEMMQTVRGFINLIKANPATREQYKSNKLATRKYDNEVNESEIHSSSLDQVQQFFNEDTDLVFDALVGSRLHQQNRLHRRHPSTTSMTSREVQPRRLLQRGN